MRLNRFALVAGLLALGVAACGDDVEVVQPTPPAPPPPPPLAASMAPESAEVEVGSSVVFAVNASGGVAGEAASWTCSSSNTGIATASTTSAGCQATGVAAGGVTITASVTKGNETANVGAQLTVTSPPAPPPFAASIAPESQSVAVGSSVVFAVNTSGGYTGMMMGDMMMAASWTCSSSDPAIATVETTEAGCQATGVSGGEVTINVAATDDHATINLVAQLTVTTDPVDPVQPFSASMAPASATVAVGSDAVFAINTSGGAADATASWTCSSSDEAIATAATTDAGCQATGVAAGGVTINAAVTKGEDSANLASQLTVTAPDVASPAFVFITEPTDGTSLDGTVNVAISVERGDQTPMGLSLLVDGEVAAHQSFGMAATPAMDEPAEQAAPLNFTLSFNSAEYNRETGAVTYLNGDHTISAQLLVAGSENPVSSNNVSVEFENEDDVHVSIAGLGDGVMNPTTGVMWYGGPAAAPEITAVPVIYSSGPVTALTLLEFCGEDAMTDDEAPFVFTPECDGTVTGEQLAFNVGGKDDAKLNWDFEGPDAPHFKTNPNMREAGWVNAAVDFLGEQKNSNKDGWLNYNHDDDKSGVGGYMPQLRFSSTTPSIVDGALAATPNAIPTEATKKDAVCVIATAVDLLGNESELPKASTACVIAEDYVGEDDEDGNTTYPAGLRAGLDVVPPTIAFSGTSPTKNDRNLSSQFQLQVTDVGATSTGKSGLHGDPVLARVEIRNAKNEVICGDDSDAKMELPGNENVRGVCENNTDGLAYDDVLDLVTTSGLPTTNPAYYTLTAVGRDKAGNHSEPIIRVALHDEGTNANATSVIGGAYDPTEAVYNLLVSVKDNFSIRDYYVALNFPTGTVLDDAVGTDDDDAAINLPDVIRLHNPVAVDAYNSVELTKSADAGGTYNAILALQGTTTTGADPVVHGVSEFVDNDSDDLESTSIHARDQSHGNRSYTTPAPSFNAEGHPDDGFPVAVAPNTDTEMVEDGIESFTFEADDSTYDIEDMIELTAEVVGYSRNAKGVLVIGDDDTDDDVTETNDVDAEDAVPFLNPFKRVDFYAVSNPTSSTTDELRFIASVGVTGTASEDIDDDDDGVDDAADDAATDEDFDTTEAEEDDVTGTAQALTIAQERDNADNKVTFSYVVEVSAADVYAALRDSGKGDYTGNVIAIGVSATDDDLTADGGVGLVSQAMSINIDK